MSQTANSFQSTALTWLRVKIPAGGQIVSRSVTGNHFMIIEQEGGQGLKFEAAFNERPFFKAALGLKYKLPAGDFFTRLSFRNESLTDDLFIELYAGTVDTEDMRLNIIRGRPAPMMHAETVLTVHSATIAAAGEVDLEAIAPPSPNYIRKATIVTNMDPAVDLDLLDETGGSILASVFPRQSFNLESSAPCVVRNNTAGPVVTRIVQLWYVVN